MKITRVERIVCDVPFVAEPARNMARAHNGWHVAEVCRVETDDGLVGYGETLPNYTWGRVTDAAVARVQGRHPADLSWESYLTGPDDPAGPETLIVWPIAEDTTVVAEHG